MTANITARDTAAPSADPGGKRNLWRILAWAGAAAAAGNGLVMMLAPGWWYQSTPGVSETGPLNVHFVRDIGGAYLAVALAIYLVLRGNGSRRALLLVAGVFMIAHAAFHLLDLAFGHGAHGAGLALEVLGVYLPALIFLPAFLPRRAPSSLPIPGSLVEAQIVKTEKRLGVKLDYMRLVAKVAPHMLMRLGRISELAGDRGLIHTPRAAAHLAMIGATQIEDCGECLQIHVNLARAERVPLELLRAALANAPDAMPEEIAAAYSFGRAVASHDPAAEDWRVKIEKMLGGKAAVELAYMVALAHFYPAFKRGLGVAQACAAVRIDLAA